MDRKAKEIATGGAAVSAREAWEQWFRAEAAREGCSPAAVDLILGSYGPWTEEDEAAWQAGEYGLFLPSELVWHRAEAEAQAVRS